MLTLRNNYNYLIRTIVFTMIVASDPGVAADRAASSVPFASVNGEVILQQTYETALRAAGRQRFYHGQPPETELMAFRQEVGERLIDERLMHQEAVRRGIAVDDAWVEAEFTKIERRYAVSPQWADQGDSLQADIRTRLAELSRIKQFEEALRTVAPPTDAQLQAYYQANADKFTSPEQVRVSSILLRVEPWQPREVWQERTAQANELHSKLLQGASFDELARQYSPDGQADLGYLHRGMLGETAQVVLDGMREGDISEVVTLLEGVAIFRLDERREPRLNPLPEVRERAAELWLREQREAELAKGMAQLRANAKVELADPDYFRAVTAPGALVEHERAVVQAE